MRTYDTLTIKEDGTIEITINGKTFRTKETKVDGGLAKRLERDPEYQAFLVSAGAADAQ